MRGRLLLGTLLVAGLTMALGPAGYGQFRGGPPGGFGGRGGFSGRGGFGAMDPGRVFDFIAKGRPYFLISDTRSLREPLEQYAKEKGITDGRITREHFTAFMEMQKAKFAGGGFPSRGGPPPSPAPMTSAAPTAGSPPPPQPSPAMSPEQWADADFRRQDENGDGKVNADEAPGSLRRDFNRYDANNDGLVDAGEYRAYFAARMQQRGGSDPNGSRQAVINPITILIEADLDRRPVVYRAGKLPKELPKWFTELDADQDGQVGLYEWRKGGKELDDFRAWDRDDDGLVTPEEALRVQAATNKDAKSGSLASSGPGRGGDDRRKGFGGSSRGDGERGGGPPWMRKRRD